MIYFNFKSTRRIQYLKTTQKHSVRSLKLSKQVKAPIKKLLISTKNTYTPLFTKRKVLQNISTYFNLNCLHTNPLTPLLRYTNTFKNTLPNLTIVNKPLSNCHVFYNQSPLLSIRSHLTPRIEPRNPISMRLLGKTKFESARDIQNLNMILTYYSSMYLLNRKYIQSKKASIIIAQVTSSGHFSTRSVYLSVTQNVLLLTKIKLNKYLAARTQTNLLFSTPKLNLHSFRPSQHSYNHKVNENLVLTPTPYVAFVNHFVNITNYLIQRIWQVTNNYKMNKRYFKNLIRNNFIKRPRRSRKKKLWSKIRGLLFSTKWSLRNAKRRYSNFLWQKKKLYWSSKQRSYLQFFSRFTRLHTRLKNKFFHTEKQLPRLFQHSSSFSTSELKTVFPITTLSNETYIPSYINANNYSYSSRILHIFFTNPWLISPLLQEVRIHTTLQHKLIKLQLPYTIKNSNLLPHASFRHSLSKKLFSLFSTNKIREDFIPFYYNTLIRFMEHCSGKKVTLQIYPFLNQNVPYDFIVRYKSWITRMKSYERRLGHKFFFEEALHIMHLSFTLRDVVLFSSWLKAIILRISFWKTRTIFRFLRYLFLIYFMHIFPELKIQGLKIRLKGKISAAGNSRKRTILYRVGETSHSKLNLRVSHSKQTINTFTGVMGFQVWLFY